MINLLPPEDQKTIKTTYRCRLLERYSLLLAGLLAVSLVLVGCLYFILTLQIEVKQGMLASLQSQRGDRAKVEQISAADINKALASMVQSAVAPRVSDFLNTLVEQKPAGIKITNLKFSHTPEMTATVSLKGVTANRQTLLDFVSSLRKINGWQNVISPYANLVKKTNAEFEVSLQVAKVTLNP